MTAIPIVKGMQPPLRRKPVGRTLDLLVKLARRLSPGEAVALSLSDAQLMRIILIAQGFDCVTDGWHCPERGKTYVFKIYREPAEQSMPPHW